MPLTSTGSLMAEPIFSFPYYLDTRGHARFARSPLVIRLGDFSEIYLYCTD